MFGDIFVEVIFDSTNNGGIKIEENDGKFYLTFDNGYHYNNMETIEISKEDSKIAQLSDADAETVILMYQNKQLGLAP
jgi:hypothetical protein